MDMYLILENGMKFKGKGFGASGEVTGEVVFTTGMTGYLETLTDQSYCGQIIVQTFPLIGNYGVIPSDFESSKIGASAYIVKHYCQTPSNFRSEGALNAFLKQQNIVGLYGIDTRTLTKIIRESGVMNGIITTFPEKVNIEEIKNYSVKNAVRKVSVKKPYFFKSEKSKYRTAILDFGIKENIKRELLKRGCDLYVFPYNTKAEEILSVKPDGIMLSNGPGDPAENTEVIENLKVLIKSNVPVFAICLGHQLLALAHGFKTSKLKYGHRGANQPVKDLCTNKVYISSQNHGYAVETGSIDKSVAKPWFENVNDGTCEGIIYHNSPICSVQFHPEACGGPLDTSFLFDNFIKNMEVK